MFFGALSGLGRRLGAQARDRAFEAAVQQQRDYLDGKLQKPEEPDGLRFDAEAWSKKDAALCSLSCEMHPGLLDFICSKQSERLRFRD